MKITKEQLKQIIKEELESVLQESELRDQQAAVARAGAKGNVWLERFTALNYVSGPCSDEASQDSLRCWAAKLRKAMNGEPGSDEKSAAVDAFNVVNKLGINIKK